MLTDGQITLAYTTSRLMGKTPAALPPVNRRTLTLLFVATDA